MSDPFKERLLANLTDLQNRTNQLADNASTISDIRTILSDLIECLIAVAS